jgi:hypothetical protein
MLPMLRIVYHYFAQEKGWEVVRECSGKAISGSKVSTVIQMIFCYKYKQKRYSGLG